MPAEPPPDQSRAEPQRLHPVHRHDEIGARQQTAPAPQTLVGSLQPEAPFAKDRSYHSRCDTDEDQRTDGDHTPDKLGKHSEASQPLAGSGYLFAPRAPVPDFERQQEIELLRGARDDRDDGKREFEQAKSEHAPRPHFIEQSGIRLGHDVGVDILLG